MIASLHFEIKSGRTLLNFFTNFSSLILDKKIVNDFNELTLTFLIIIKIL